MAYQCRQCNRVGSEAGACPVCNIPMDIRLQDVQPDMTPAVEPIVPAEDEKKIKEVPEVAPEMPMTAPAEEATEGGGQAMA